MHTGDMNKGTKNKNNGFGIQRDITADGATIHLRITNPRRLNVELLGNILLRYLQGGYETMILDQGRGARKKMKLVEFLGQLQVVFNETRLRLLERKLVRDRVSF
jgi:hypothetical protein